MISYRSEDKAPHLLQNRHPGKKAFSQTPVLTNWKEERSSLEVKFMIADRKNLYEFPGPVFRQTLDRTEKYHYVK